MTVNDNDQKKLVFGVVAMIAAALGGGLFIGDQVGYNRGFEAGKGYAERERHRGKLIPINQVPEAPKK